MFPRSLVVAHQRNEDRRNKSRCVLFPFQSEPSVLEISEAMGTDLFNHQMIGLPDNIEEISLNSQEYCHVCKTVSTIVLEMSSLRNTKKLLPFPYLSRNVEIEDAIQSFLSNSSLVNNGSLVIECKSSSSRHDSAISFSQWFELFNHDIICDFISNETPLWNETIIDVIKSTDLYQRRNTIHYAMKNWTTWKCAAPDLLPLLSQAIGDHTDETVTSTAQLASLSNHFYLVTLPNGQTSTQHCITHLPMHIGQYRFSPLPLSVDLVTLVDPRHRLLSEPNTSVFNNMEVCCAKYYRSLRSSLLCGTDDNLLEKYIALAEDVVDNKTSFEHSNKVIEEKQLRYNFAASLSGKEEAASEILRALIHRTDFYSKMNHKLQGTSKCNDTFEADKTKINKSDNVQTALLSKHSRKQLRYAKLLSESQELTDELSTPPQDMVCVQPVSGRSHVSSSSSSGLVVYRVTDNTMGKSDKGSSYRMQPLRIQDQFKSFEPLDSSDDEEDSPTRGEWGVGSYKGLLRTPKRVSDMKRQILYRHPGWRKVPRIVVDDGNKLGSKSRQSRSKNSRMVVGLEGLTLSDDVNGEMGATAGADASAAVVSANNSVSDGDISSISEDHHHHREDRHVQFDFDRWIGQERTQQGEEDEGDNVDPDDISYQDVEMAVIENEDSDGEGQDLRKSKQRQEDQHLHLNAIDFDYLRQFADVDEVKPKKHRLYMEDPFAASSSAKEGVASSSDGKDYSTFVNKFVDRRAPTKTLQKICSELVELHRSEKQYSRRILDSGNTHSHILPGIVPEGEEVEQAHQLLEDMLKNANIFSLTSILMNKAADLDKHGALKLSDRNIRLKVFQELSDGDPTIRSVESVVAGLEDTFGCSLDDYVESISLYHKIACQRYYIHKAQELMFHFGEVVLKIPEQRKQWKACVGVRREFDDLPDRSRQALAFYRRTKEERAPSAVVKRKRRNSSYG